MSLADQVEELMRTTALRRDDQADEIAKQFRDLAYAEETLRRIGVTLKPKFNISLRTIIG